MGEPCTVEGVDKYQSCTCSVEDGYTELCDGEGEDGVGAACMADGAPKYKSCTCKPTYNELCNGQGEVGTLGAASACTADGGSKYEGCTCDSVHQKLCDGTGEMGDSLSCTADGGDKYSACKCKPSYDKVCGGTGEEGVDTACTVEGIAKYQSCKCQDEYNQLCDGNGQQGKNEACTVEGVDKYTICECEAQYQECPCGGTMGAASCTIGGVTKWDTCASCCNDDCSFDFSKTDPGGLRETEITGCGTTCYKACGAGHIWDSSNCTLPATLGGAVCAGKYTSCSCPAGYSTEYQSVSDCGNGTGGSVGWTYTSSGSVGSVRCGKCTSNPCSDGSISYQSAANCGVGSSTGWNFSVGSYSGDSICGVCTERNGCSIGYNKDVTSCTTPKTLSTGGYYGNQVCGLCSCPSSYSQSCSSPQTGVGAVCDSKYQSCSCGSAYNQTCSGDYVGVGASCNGKYQSCQCLYTNVSCLLGETCTTKACGGTVCTACAVTTDYNSECRALGYRPMGEIASNPQVYGCGGHFGKYYTLPEWTCPYNSGYILRCGVCADISADSCKAQHGYVDAGRGRNDIIWYHNKCNWATN